MDSKMNSQDATRPIIKKTRCACEGCKNKTAPIIGLCGFCNSKFCAIHRLPETHACINMSKCRETHFKRNEEKLLSEKCVAAKV